MLYVVIIIVFFAAVMLVLNLRMRLELSGERRLLFVGLGRTGPQIDFKSRVIRLQLWGWTLKTTAFGKQDRKAEPSKPQKKKPKEKSKRLRSWRDFLGVLPVVLDAVGSYMLRLLGSVAIEEFRGEIKGGFPSPDLTGQAYGYYQAALGTIPALAGRFSFVPDWTGPSLAGSIQLSLTLPLYRLMWHTSVMIIRLPLKKLISLAIGKKRGEDNV